MPRKGWKMPPGYAGYKRSTPSRRTPSRSAGPRMLSSLALPAPQNGASNGIDHGNEDVGDDAQPSTDSLNDFRAQNAAEQVPGLISSRLRPRRSQEGQVQGGGSDGGECTTDTDDDELVEQAEDEQESGSDDEDEQPLTRRFKKNKLLVQDDDDDTEEAVSAGDTLPDTQDPNARFVMNTSLPLLELSVTLSKHKGHVLPAWLALVYSWMKLRCVAGAAALERGGKNQNLHVQIMLRMHICEQDIEALKLELKSLVGWRRGDGSGTYCSAKEFGAGQSWTMMLGYLHKDQGQPHFKVEVHNVDPTDVVKGIAEWQTAKLSYEDGKILITRANVFHRLATWRVNAAPESNNSFLQDMTDMLNTQKYMVSSLLVTQSGAMRLVSAEALWHLIKGIEPMTIELTRDLFFPFGPAPRPGAPEAGQRYFDAFPLSQAF